MRNNLFTVESYDKSSSNIIVTISNDHGEKEVKLVKSKFEAWLDRTGRLASVMQLVDEEETAELAFSAMTIKEYYEHGDVELDLYDFILISKGDKIFEEALNDMQSICKEFKN